MSVEPPRPSEKLIKPGLTPNQVENGRFLGEHGDEDSAGPRAVELAQEDALPGPEREIPLAQRDQQLRPHQRRADVRRRVLLSLLDVLPSPALGRDLLERHLEVAR